MNTLYTGPPIDDTYQVSAQLAGRIQRRRITCEKLLTEDRLQLITKARLGFRPSELKRYVNTTVLGKKT
jgi:hypothetical protein